jgi:hypothetical protein
VDPRAGLDVEMKIIIIFGCFRKAPNKFLLLPPRKYNVSQPRIPVSKYQAVYDENQKEAHENNLTYRNLKKVVHSVTTVPSGVTIKFTVF